MPALQSLTIGYNKKPKPGQLGYNSLACLQHSPLQELDLCATSKMLVDNPQLSCLQLLRLHGSKHNNQLWVPHTLSSLCTLQGLDISFLKLAGDQVGLGTIAQLTSLSIRFVGLAGSDARTMLPWAISNLANLRSLMVGSCPFDVQADALSGLTNLTKLELIKLKLGGELSAFSIPVGLTQLIELDLSGNVFRRLPSELTCLARLTQVQFVWQECGLQPSQAAAAPFTVPAQVFPGLQLDDSLIKIACMPSLRHLVLYQSQQHNFSTESIFYSAAAAKAMQAAGSSCQIEY